MNQLGGTRELKINIQGDRDEVGEIRSLRDQSNAAILSRNVDRVVSLMMHDVVVTVAGGPVLSGRDASRNAFAEQFADKTFRGYVRETEHVDVRKGQGQATERGRWVGRWENAAGPHEMRGAYVAEWKRTEVGWLIQSEAFVAGTWAPPKKA